MGLATINMLVDEEKMDLDIDEAVIYKDKIFNLQFIRLKLYQLRVLTMCRDTCFGRRCIRFVLDNDKFKEEVSTHLYDQYHKLLSIVFNPERTNFEDQAGFKKAVDVNVEIPGDITTNQLVAAIQIALGYQVINIFFYMLCVNF